MLYFVGLHNKQVTLSRTQNHITFGWPTGEKLKGHCPARAPDRSQVAADPRSTSDNVWAVWVTGDEMGLTSFKSIKAIYSTNAGATFLPSGNGTITVYDEPTPPTSNFIVEAPVAAVDLNGDCYFAWARFSEVSSDFCPGGGCPPSQLSPTNTIQVRRARLSGGAVTFDPGVNSTPVFRGFGRQFIAFNNGLHGCAIVSMAVDTTAGPYSGKIYVATIEALDGALLTPTFRPSKSRVNVYRYSPGGAAGGVTLDTTIPILVSEPDAADPAQNPMSLQDLPWIAVDQRGNVGVAWYDTRYDPCFPPPASPCLPSDHPCCRLGTDAGRVAFYDIMFSYSTDGGMSWSRAKRLTRPLNADGLPLSRTHPFPKSRRLEPGGPMITTSPSNLSDYSQIAADPRPGHSGFFVMAMENHRVPTYSADGPVGVFEGHNPLEQDMYAYHVRLAIDGDGNNDYLVNFDDNSAFVSCLISSEDCNCAVFDMNNSGTVDFNDMDCFVEAVVRPCHPCDCTASGNCPPHVAPCQPSGEGGEALMVEGDPCALAAQIVATFPPAQLAFALEQYDQVLRDQPARSDAAQIAAFLACLGI